MSWTCRCGETHDDSFEACWSCGTERSEQASSAAAVLGAMPPSTLGLDDSRPCPHCGRRIDARATRCSHCLEKMPVGTAGNAITNNADTAGIHSKGSSGALLSNRALKRYRDAYSVASNIDAYGQAIKTLASIIAVITIVITLIASTQAEGKTAGGLFFAGAITAAVLWTTIHAHGVRIAAEGQHLLAALDVAVHTSPFLSDVERAQAMSLK
jgi:hypothetical protein